jgi:hypothetical protein
MSSRSQRDEKKKSPSQLLRAVLYLWWEGDTQGFEDFESFYENYMNKMIDHIKNKLK